MEKNNSKTTNTTTTDIPTTAGTSATKPTPAAPPALEMTYRISGGETGAPLEVAPTATGLEIRELNEKGKVAERVSVVASQIDLVIEAMRRLAKTGA